jgi:hypothetical protein
MAEGEPTLEIVLKNERPVQFRDLTGSLDALGDHYENFVFSRGYDPLAGNVRLYVKELRSGSIIAVLQSLAEQASFVQDHLEMMTAFLTNFDDMMKFFLAYFPAEHARPLPIYRTDAERLNQVLEPVAKDGGSQLILSVAGDMNLTVNIGSQEANAAQNSIRRFLGPQLPQFDFFTQEVLYLRQVRDDASSRAGDRGVIEKFSPKPVKLLFLTPEAKRMILDQPDNPFRLAFIVDGEISRIGGEPAAYKIYAVHESFERE